VKPDQKYRYQKAEDLTWTEAESDLGKAVHLRESPQDFVVKLLAQYGNQGDRRFW
jgi:hypothetical protein